jgi:aldose 1-epimerase
VTLAERTRTRHTAIPELVLHHAIGGVDLRAAVDLVGGGLRALTHGRTDLVEPYTVGQPAPYGAGAILFPWPNRVRAGLWTQRGVHHQLPVNEVDLGNAAHGLVCNHVFTVEGRGESSATISTVIEPQPGYPFQVRVKVTYRLTDDGLDVGYRITNESSWTAPVALGQHPYVRIGDVPTGDLTVCIEADTYFQTDGQLIPVKELPVDGTPADLRHGRRVDGLDLNTCYGNLTMDDGRHRHLVSAPDGRAVEVWASPDFGFVQIYTCSFFPTDRGDGLALAIEPMTAPPDALNSGRGLKWLEPTAEWVLSWGIRPIAITDCGAPQVASALRR